MGIVDEPYWIWEFLKVLMGYVLVQFLWPRFVFARHLSGKSVIYQFSFCVTVQTVLINTAVLGLGLVHILNAWTVRVVFWGVPVAVVYWQLGVTEEKAVSFANRLLIFRSRLLLKRLCWSIAERGRKLLRRIRPHALEYLLLAILAVYALIYFSWGALQTAVYTYPDQYTHHAWIYSMIQGKVFSAGVYPEAMHCLLYTIHAVLGVRVYSLLLFFGSVQSVMFLLACYCLLRELFAWCCTPIFVLAVFMLFGTENEEVLAGMSRLQATLPLEYALAAQMICVLFLIRYLRSEGKVVEKGRLAGYLLNKELFVFMMALATILVSHFHPLIKAFALCVGVAVFHLKKVFSRKCFLPLAGAVLCGVLIAFAPMATGLVSGIPMQGSIQWAVGVINGAEDPDLRESETGELEEALEGETSALQRFVKTASFGVEVFLKTYEEFLGGRWGAPALLLMAVIIGCCAAFGFLLLILPQRAREWISASGFDQLLLRKYLLLVAMSLLMTFIYAMPYLGLPELIHGRRLVTTQRVLLFAAMAIPLDFLFALLMLWLKTVALRGISILCLAMICAWVINGEDYHGYLYGDLTRYSAAVRTMESIINAYPKFSYTVVSPTDGLYQTIESGWHEELLSFVEQIADERYFLPSEHIFIFVEKKPIRYAQPYGYAGPRWLALSGRFPDFVSQAPSVDASEVSKEEAEKELMDLDAPFRCYVNWESRTIIESKAYYWCQQFMELYPNEMDVYYEDDSFVCYYLHQNPNSPFDLAISGEKQ